MQESLTAGLCPSLGTVPGPQQASHWINGTNRPTISSVQAWGGGAPHVPDEESKVETG